MPVEAASGLFRSQDMVQMDVVVPRDAAHDCIYHVGLTGIAQFIDQNAHESAFARTFTAEIRRCDDLDRRLRYFQDLLTQYHISTTALTSCPDLPANAIDRLERDLDGIEGSVRDAAFALENLRADHTAHRELEEVLKRVRMGGYDQVGAFTSNNQGLVQIAGVMPSRHDITFHRLIFRVSRGNALVKTEPIEGTFEEILPSGQHVFTEKSVFVVFVSSKRLHEKIRKIADSLGARTLSSEQLQKESVPGTLLRLKSLEETMSHSLNNLTITLRRVAIQLPTWQAMVITEKAVYSNLNLVKCSGTTAKAQVWIPDQDVNTFHEALVLGCNRAGSKMTPIVHRSASQKGHPTYFNTNKFTEVFQGLVDSFGIARYKEVNPAVLTVITFPYLFGVMFGDLGHGVMLTLFGAFLVLFEKKLATINNEMFTMIYGGRYLIFMMGLFATYVGILYNDFFGMSLEIFKSGYEWPALTGRGASKGLVHPLKPNGLPSVKPVVPVVFGIDVAWTETENKLEFYNSVKMKCAVIIGVIQMTVGLFLSLMNHLRNKDWRHIWFGFVPEVVFMTCTFGYMCLLIVVKWCMPWPNTNLAPSLLETMTNFFLAPGHVSVPLYSGQATVQTILLLIAVAQVPVLLLANPYLEWKDAKRKQEAVAARPAASSVGRRSLHDPEADGADEHTQMLEGNSHHSAAAAASHDDDDDDGGHGHGGKKGFDMGEVAIHYSIHTIEFVLGCVSNTASYLRLWALSLAHAQLSDVFLNFCLVKAIDADGGHGVILFIGVAVWLGATIGILLCMESLSAFLHALRLHWVEFQSKFYVADGHAFVSFDLVKANGLSR